MVKNITQKEIIITLKLVDLYKIKNYKWLLTEHNMRNDQKSFLLGIKMANSLIGLIVDRNIKRAIKQAKKYI